MPEQIADADCVKAALKDVLQDSQIRVIRLRSIEVRLEDEIKELKNGWWKPKHMQKAAILESAKMLVARVMSDSRQEQVEFKKEIEEGEE